MANQSESAKTRAELIAEFDSFPPDTRLAEDHVAAKLKCSTAKLQRDRIHGSPIPFIREGGTRKADKNGLVRIFGGRVFYLKKDVLEYLETRNRTVTSTTAFSTDAAA